MYAGGGNSRNMQEGAVGWAGGGEKDNYIYRAALGSWYRR